ncbi:hypothetical protein ACKI2C_49605, partial [Streptomyces brasiliscabiei]
VDTASIGNAPAIAAVSALLPAGHVLFGSDFPYVAPAQEVRELQEAAPAGALDAAAILSAAGALLPSLHTH